MEKNPAHRLILGKYPIIYRVLYIPGGAGFLNRQQYGIRQSECGFVWEKLSYCNSMK